MIASMTNNVPILSIQQFWWDIKRKTLTCFLSSNMELRARRRIAGACRAILPSHSRALRVVDSSRVRADATPQQSHFLPVTQYGTGRHVDLCVEGNARKW